MVRKWLAAGLVLALCSLLFVGRSTVHAYTYDDLSSLLVTQSDISDTGLNFYQDQQQDLGGGVVQVLRIFNAPVQGGAAVAVVSLIGANDGSTPPTSVTNLVLGGDLLKETANSIGAQVGNFTLAGSQGIGDTDQSAQFDAILDGTTYRFYGDAFVSNNLIGIVVYGAPIDVADPSNANTILSAQDAKLP